MVGAFASRLFATDLAVDLGTSNTRIFASGQGLVVEEPSIVASRSDDHGVVAVGHAAKAMLGREPPTIRVVRPLASGVIAEPDLAQKLLATLMTRVPRRGWRPARPRVIASVPSGITRVEQRAVRDLVLGAGAREVFLVPAPFAAAIGAGLPIQDAGGNMIVTLGGGTTEVALLSLSGVVHSESIRTGGDEMDEAIVGWLRKHHGLMIGTLQAEAIKLALGSARPVTAGRRLPVKGRGVVDGLPTTVLIGDDEVGEALRESIVTVVEAVRTALERTPPELAADVLDHGIVLAGAGALLPALADVIHLETGLPVAVAEDPATCAARGAGRMLESLDILKRIAIDAPGGSRTR